MEVGQSKMPNSEVAGQASVFFSGFKYRKQHVQGGSRETSIIAYVARVEQTRKRFKPRMYGR
jgi:Rps23 Pro-64 3,4-dihydroxylase Tpa1-like proline 4-hydroxylase